ncbi:MAG: glycosyltransferase family A protein [Cyclobacteriaceae bacterium]
MTATSFRVSVVIPVYNAENFLHRAVDSALMQPEVAEILLIEDGSADNSLAICRELEKNHTIVKLLIHENNTNRGPGITRNKGIENASCEYLAFLDADDFYLENRFANTQVTFDDKSIDGVYEVIGVSYDSEEMKEKHLERMRNNKKNMTATNQPLDHTGIDAEIAPEELFYKLLTVENGWLHLNGITIRRARINDMPWFNDNFLGQDSEFLTRLAAKKRLTGTGHYDPVAIRYVHKDNRILKSGNKKRNRTAMNNGYWLKYCIDNKIYGKEVIYLLKRVSDTNGKLKKALLLGKNSIKTLTAIIGIRKTEQLNF